MNKIIKGKDAQNATWQDKFPATTKCSCGGKAHLIFTYYEGLPTEKELNEYICQSRPKGLKKNDLWFHDCCAIANYACVKCLEVTTLSNQA